MTAILSKLSILFISYISRDLDNIKKLLYKLFVRYTGCQTYKTEMCKSRTTGIDSVRSCRFSTGAGAGPGVDIFDWDRSRSMQEQERFLIIVVLRY